MPRSPACRTRSEKAVELRLYRARKLLRDLLTEHLKP
jgi:hypothetical protein